MSAPDASIMVTPPQVDDEHLRALRGAQRLESQAVAVPKKIAPSSSRSLMRWPSTRSRLACSGGYTRRDPRVAAVCTERMSERFITARNRPMERMSPVITAATRPNTTVTAATRITSDMFTTSSLS
jgi:hypothetical protein